MGDRTPGSTTGIPLRAYRPVRLGAIRPAGWLRDELVAQANGLTGDLESVWPDVGPTSGWLGGDGEDWPRFIMSKAIAQYAEWSGDTSVWGMLRRFFHFVAGDPVLRRVDEWSRMRGADGAWTAYLTAEATGDPMLVRAARTIMRATADWSRFFATLGRRELLVTAYRRVFGDADPGDVGVPAIERAIPWYHETHGVNLAMGVKHPAVAGFLRSGSIGTMPRPLAAGLAALDESYGTPIGAFGADEHLHDAQSHRGIELCQIVELMYSLETIIAITGDLSVADRLERLAFNALPAAFLDAYTVHQYFQQPNQVRCTVAPRSWYTRAPEGNVFGVEPHFGCCTANLHQGWPKLVSHLVGVDPHGALVLLMTVPFVARLDNGHGSLSIEVETSYPFRDEIDVWFRSRTGYAAPVRIRVPQGVARDPVVSSDLALESSDGMLVLAKIPTGTHRVRLVFEYRVQTVARPNRSVSVERGPIVFAYPIVANRTERASRFARPDVDLEPAGAWRFALASVSPTVERVQATALGRASLALHATLVPSTRFAADESEAIILPLPEEASSDAPGHGTADSTQARVDATLVPYAEAPLRIAVFPDERPA